MSTNLEYRERERHENEKVGDRLAMLNEKKSDRELEREINNEEEIFWKLCCGGKKIRNASDQVSKRTRTTFPP